MITKMEHNCQCQWDALMGACHVGNSAEVSRLVQVPGLDIDYQNEHGFTAAYWATKMGQTECVRILAETGRVDWNKRDKVGRTPLYMAIMTENFDIVDIIVGQPDIDYNVKTELGISLAHEAVGWGDVKCVETLAALETFDCWNVPNRDGETPMMIAIMESKTEILEILLRCPRVDPDVDINPIGETAARLATMQGETECVRMLAETGRVDWNQTDCYGYTPLNWALMLGRSEIVDIILEQPNIDLNGKNHVSQTLAHTAVTGGHVKCVETLAAQESFDCWNVPDYMGNTPMKIALSSRSEIVEILLRCPRVDLDVVDADKKHLEENTENNLIKNQLWTFRSVQQRMILRDSLLTRQAGSVSSLQSLSRDAVLLILSTNNTQERLVAPLVDRLEGEITTRAREMLLTAYSLR